MLSSAPSFEIALRTYVSGLRVGLWQDNQV